MKKKNHITKGEEFYKKNKRDKKNKSLYEIIQATKNDIDDYYSNDNIDVKDLLVSHYVLNSGKYLKNNIALVLVLSLATSILGNVFTRFSNSLFEQKENINSMMVALLSPLDDFIVLFVSVLVIVFILYKRILKDYTSPLDAYIFPYEKKIVCAKIEAIDKEMYEMITQSE